LALSTGLGVMISMQHDFESSFANTGAEILYERSVFVQRVNGPSASELLRYFFAIARSTERDYGQRNRSPLSDFAVGMLKFFRQGEKASVIVADTEIHQFHLSSF